MMEKPEWNPSDPRASLLAYGEFLHEHARSVFLADGTHLEILFLLDENGTVQPQPIAKPMTREGVAQTLREGLPGSGVYGLVHIAEAWGYVPEGETDHTVTQLKAGEMAVSELKCQDRIELLTVSLLSRDGERIAWFDEIVREADGTCRIGRSGELSNARFPLGEVFSQGERRE